MLLTSTLRADETTHAPPCPNFSKFTGRFAKHQTLGKQAGENEAIAVFPVLQVYYLTFQKTREREKKRVCMRATCSHEGRQRCEGHACRSVEVRGGSRPAGTPTRDGNTLNAAPSCGGREWMEKVSIIGKHSWLGSALKMDLTLHLPGSSTSGFHAIRFVTAGPAGCRRLSLGVCTGIPACLPAGCRASCCCWFARWTDERVRRGHVRVCERLR